MNTRAENFLKNMTTLSPRRTLSVDFDGVISNSLHGGYDQNEFIFNPVNGVVEWLNEMVLHFNVIIFTARDLSEIGRLNLHAWLIKWGFPAEHMEYTNVKPPETTVFLDDRGMLFTGNNYPSVEYINSFRPWNR